MVVIKKYIDSKNLRLVDFFNTIDKDKSMTVTVQEFEQGLAVSCSRKITVQGERQHPVSPTEKCSSPKHKFYPQENLHNCLCPGLTND